MWRALLQRQLPLITKPVSLLREQENKFVDNEGIYQSHKWFGRALGCP